MIRLPPQIDGKAINKRVEEKDHSWLAVLIIFALCGGTGALSLYIKEITLIILIAELLVTGIFVAIMIWLWTLMLKEKIATAKEDARIARAGQPTPAEPRYRK